MLASFGEVAELVVGIEGGTGFEVEVEFLSVFAG